MIYNLIRHLLQITDRDRNFNGKVRTYQVAHGLFIVEYLGNGSWCFTLGMNASNIKPVEGYEGHHEVRDSLMHTIQKTVIAIVKLTN